MIDTNNMQIRLQIFAPTGKEPRYEMVRSGEDISVEYVTDPESNLVKFTAELRDSSGKRWRCVFEELPRGE